MIKVGVKCKDDKHLETDGVSLEFFLLERTLVHVSGKRV
jgi:hypothetical protein